MSYRGDLSQILDFISVDMTTPNPGSLLLIPALLSTFPLDPVMLGKYFGVGFIIWLIWFVSDWIDYDRKKNMRPGEEHGSASFNLNYGQVEHDYIMSPRILKQMVEEMIFYRTLGLDRNKKKKGGKK